MKARCVAVVATMLLLFTGPARADFISVDIPGAINTYVFGVNNAGQAAGFYNPNGSSSLPFIRNGDGTYFYFAVPDATDQVVFDINNNGDVVGSVNTPIGARAFVRDASGVITFFEVPGASQTVADGINDLGEIVGHYVAAGVVRGFFRSSSGDFTLLDIDGATYNNPSKLNSSGVIVGNSSGGYGAYVGTVAGGFESLGIRDSLAMGINNLGDIVGRIDPSAFILYESGSFATHAGQFYDISDLGLIGGTYMDGNGRVRGLLGAMELQHVVPEPETLALLCLGLLGLGLTRRKAQPTTNTGMGAP